MYDYYLDYDDSNEPREVHKAEQNFLGVKLPLGKTLNDIQMHGTTTLSFIFEGGVIVAADSRSSMGPYVSSRTVKKIMPISSHVLATMAGGAADCAQFIRWTAANIKVSV